MLSKLLEIITGAGENSITPGELSEKIPSSNPPLLLDVREESEHQSFALPNAKLIPLGELAFRTDEIKAWKDKEVVVYCSHGFRSRRGASILRKNGFAQVRSLHGGIKKYSGMINHAGCE
ncbi:MAG: rhodanese-like domain-containing protein [Verrucomicrobia bacterium]|nr:rhodanese-like domain-containing protein [Verrucomicrobiota bacterium]